MIKKIVGAGLAAVVLSGCTLLPGAAKPITGNTQEQSEKLAAIIAKGGSAVCQITSLTDNSQTEITVKGQKMRFVGSDIGEGKKGTMINDGVYTYIWSEGEKTGIKTKIVSPTPAEPAVTAVPDEDQVEADKYEDETKYKMNCTSGNVSDSAFIPPAEVTFTDFSQMMPSLPAGIPSIPAMPNVQY